MAKTMADQIAAQFGDDGLRWYDDDGRYLVDVLLEAGAREERFGSRTRFILPDKSVLIMTPGGWDHGFSECFCMAGLGHADHCPAGGGKVVVYAWSPGLCLHEGDLSDWDFETPDADDYESPRAEALYQALGADPGDIEYQLAVHKDGRWGLFGLRVEGHQYAVEAK